MKKILSLVLALCLVLTAFVGCEGTAPAEAPAEGETATAEKTHEVLRIGEYDEEWVGADLIQGDTFYDLQMMMAEPLWLYNHETGELEACLAEAPTFNEDGTVMTFVVPEGRTFPNGAEMGADDVAASLQHGMDVGVNYSSGYGLLKSVTYEGNTVTCELDHYGTELMILLVSPFFCVIDTEQFDTMTNEELLWGAVPYGAYYIADYQEGAGVTLKRNDGFKTLNGTVENKEAAYVPTIEVTWYSDEFAMIAAYKAGQLDMLIGVTEDSLNELGNMEGTIVHSSLPPMVRDVEINNNREYLSDIRVRQAINLIIDRDTIVAAFGGDVMCTAQYEYITENVMYHTPEVEEWFKGECNDLEKAAALLAEAGWSDTNGDGIVDKDGVNMPTLQFLTASGKNETAALTIQIMLQNAGIPCEVITTSDHTDLTKQGEYDLHMTNYWWSEPHNYLVNQYKDHNHFDETEFRALVDQLGSTTDNAKRFELVDQAQRYLLETYTVLPLYTTSYVKIYNESLSNIHFIVDGMFLNDIK